MKNCEIVMERAPEFVIENIRREKRRKKLKEARRRAKQILEEGRKPLKQRPFVALAQYIKQGQ